MDKLTQSMDPNAALNVPLLLLMSIEERWEKYLDELKCFRQEPSGDTVRTLRVATRRLRTLMEILGDVQTYKPLKKAAREYKDQLNDLDDLRDTQVMLGEVSGEVQQFPVLKGFQEELEEKNATAMKKTRKKFKQVEPAETARVLVRWMERLDGDERKDIPDVLRQSIDDSYREVRDRFGQVDPNDPATIHQVRLAFKEFRYKIIVLQPLLPELPAELLKCMDKYQDWMGGVQDVVVLSRKLTDFAGQHPEVDLQPVSRFYQDCLTHAVAEYMKHKDMLNDFWRPAPGQPFPWRTSDEDLPAQTRNCDGA